jgi:hypothetical protein
MLKQSDLILETRTAATISTNMGGTSRIVSRGRPMLSLIYLVREIEGGGWQLRGGLLCEPKIFDTRNEAIVFASEEAKPNGCIVRQQTGAVAISVVHSTAPAGSRN